MALQIILVLVLAGGIAGLFWVMLRRSSEKIVAQYRILAEHLGLELTEPPAQMGGFNRPEPFVHGIYRGREMSISVPGKGLQNTRQIETRLKLEVAEQQFQWQMTPAGWLGGMRQRDSGIATRWSSGDADFDAAIDVRTNDADRMARLLDESGRSTIQGLLRGTKATIALRGGMLSYAELGLIADETKRQQFEQIVEIFCDLAESVETTKPVS